MITYWDSFGEFRFYNMRFNKGTLFKREFGPSSKLFPFFDVLIVFFTMPTVLSRISSHVPKKGGGGSNIPVRGAPVPP